MVGLWECGWLPPTLGGSDWSVGEWGPKAGPPAPMGGAVTQKGCRSPSHPQQSGVKKSVLYFLRRSCDVSAGGRQRPLRRAAQVQRKAHTPKCVRELAQVLKGPGEEGSPGACDFPGKSHPGDQVARGKGEDLYSSPILGFIIVSSL